MKRRLLCILPALLLSCSDPKADRPTETFEKWLAAAQAGDTPTIRNLYADPAKAEDRDVQGMAEMVQKDGALRLGDEPNYKTETVHVYEVLDAQGESVASLPFMKVDGQWRIAYGTKEYEALVEKAVAEAEAKEKAEKEKAKAEAPKPCGTEPQVISDTKIGLCALGDGKFVGSTSLLAHKKKPMFYGPASAFDGKPGTSWVEGKEDDGIGEKLAFQIPAGSQYIRILPGYGKKSAFAKNNRVKSARLTIYSVGSPKGGVVEVKEKLHDVTLDFKDKMKLQPEDGVNFRPTHAAVGVLEIVSVYKGKKYQDTCISEVEFSREKPYNGPPILGQWHHQGMEQISLYLAKDGTCEVEEYVPQLDEDTPAHTRTEACDWKVRGDTVIIDLEKGKARLTYDSEEPSISGPGLSYDPVYLVRTDD